MIHSSLISIITPCYNQGQYLDEAIKSIESIKTPYLFEHIIINDGSTDAFTIEKFKELELKGYCVIHQKNMGLANARNNAIATSKGKYILPLDADNKLHSNYLTDAVDILESGSAEIIYGDAIFFGETHKVYHPPALDITTMLKYNRIDACAIFKKDIWERIGGYDPGMPSMGAEDWDFWINCLLSDAKFFYLPKECFYYRVRKNSMSATITNPSLEENRAYILKKYANEIFRYHETQMRKLEILEYKAKYFNNHKFKTAINLLLNRSI